MELKCEVTVLGTSSGHGQMHCIYRQMTLKMEPVTICVVLLLCSERGTGGLSVAESSWFSPVRADVPRSAAALANGVAFIAMIVDV